MSQPKSHASDNTSVRNGINGGKSTTTTTNNSTAMSSRLEEPRGPAASSQKQASTVWHEYVTVSKKMAKYSRAYSDIEGIMDEYSAMKLETRTKDMRISSLESTLEGQVNLFEKRYSKWNEERILLERREATVKDEVMAQNEGILRKQKAAHAEVIRELDVEKNKVTNLTGKLEKANKRIERAETDLAFCKGQLRRWESHVSKLTDMDLEALYVNLYGCDLQTYNILKLCPQWWQNEAALHALL